MSSSQITVPQISAPALQASPLTSIPLECLLQITRNLNTLDYCKLRLTCKQIEDSLFHAFSREFFSKRQFMISPFSLQTLVDISKSRFSSSLTQVIIGLEQPLRQLERGTLSLIRSPRMLKELSSEDTIAQEYINQIHLINTNQDINLLVEAFKNLPNLVTIGMRDFNSRSRYRDYPKIDWRSYGVGKFLEETGIPLTMPQRTNIFAPDHIGNGSYSARVFLNLLLALGQANRRVKNFEIILRQSGLWDHAFELPQYIQSSVHPVLANLETLFLDLNPSFMPAKVAINNVATLCISYRLMKFLSNTAQLEHLRLNFHSSDIMRAGFDNTFGQEMPNELLSWLSKSPSDITVYPTPITKVHAYPQPVQFSNLRFIEIGFVRVDFKVLLSLIRKYRASLRGFSFHKVCLSTTNPGSDDDEVTINLWAKFFQGLSKLDLKLSSMNLSFITQEATGKFANKGIILAVSFQDSKIYNVKHWAGTDSQSGLRDFVHFVKVSKPPTPHTTPSGSENDDDGENSDDGDNSDDEEMGSDGDDGNSHEDDD